MNQLIIFAHIPKTAGSSFRHEAEEHFGAEKTLRDYGVQAKKSTSPLVVEWVYERSNLAGFAKVVNQGGFRFLAGHFSYPKYARVLPDAAYVCWIRDPVAQVWSHYRHHRRNQGYEGDLESFYRSPRFCNMQTRGIGEDPDRMAFIGITEEYSASLKRFNEQFSLDFKERRSNRAPDTESDGPQPSEAQKERIRALNDKDMALYESIRQRFGSGL